MIKIRQIDNRWKIPNFSLQYYLPWTHESFPVVLSSLNPERDGPKFIMEYKCKRILYEHMIILWANMVNQRERETLKRFIKILMLSNELTYRTITAEFERSSSMSPNSWSRLLSEYILYSISPWQMSLVSLEKIIK